MIAVVVAIWGVIVVMFACSVCVCLPFSGEMCFSFNRAPFRDFLMYHALVPLDLNATSRNNQRKQ